MFKVLEIEGKFTFNSAVQLKLTCKSHAAIMPL